MKSDTPVAEIMTKDVITLDHKDSLDTAERLFKTHHIRHIPVVKEGKIAGMLSHTDLLRISFADSYLESDGTIDTEVYNMLTTDQVMVRNVVSVSSQSSIKDTARILAEKEFHALPVVDEGKLEGIITTTDLIKYFLSHCF